MDHTKISVVKFRGLEWYYYPDSFTLHLCSDPTYSVPLTVEDYSTIQKQIDNE